MTPENFLYHLIYFLHFPNFMVYKVLTYFFLRLEKYWCSILTRCPFPHPFHKLLALPLKFHIKVNIVWIITNFEWASSHPRLVNFIFWNLSICRQTFVIAWFSTFIIQTKRAFVWLLVSPTTKFDCNIFRHLSDHVSKNWSVLPTLTISF